MFANHLDRFNIAAQEYATDRYPGRAECARKVLDLLEPRLDDVILDVGCGPGIQLAHLAQSIRSGYGIDPAEQMINKAQELTTHCPNLHFHIGSTTDFPQEIHHAGINKIMSNYALHHIPDNAKRESLRNLATLLPDDGMIVLGDLVFSDDPDNSRALYDIVGYGPGCDTPSQLSLLESMFLEAGLTPCAHILNPLVAVVVGKKEITMSSTQTRTP